MTVNGTLRLSLALPPGYRPDDILRFHQRDPEQTAERVEGRTLVKGLAWCGQPAALHVHFEEWSARVEVQLGTAFSDGDEEAMTRLCQRLLGLTQPVEAFEEAHHAHPDVGRLIRARPGLRVAQAATPFEAATWAVIGQQISVSAATAVRRKLIRAADLRHASGVLAYPDAERVAAMDDDSLRATGLSRTKVHTIRALSDGVVNSELPLGAGAELTDVDALRTRLRAIRGVGPWTVNYTLLRGFSWLDGAMEGDLGVRRSLQSLLGRREQPGERETGQWLAEFSPWRALVAAHLWAMSA